MEMINRTAVVVKAARPYYDWAMSVHDGTGDWTLEKLHEFANVYLIPDVEGEGDPGTDLKPYWKAIFENELETWHLIIDDWPSPLTFKMFLEWFDFEFHVIVLDLWEGPLEREVT